MAGMALKFDPRHVSPMCQALTPGPNHVKVMYVEVINCLTQWR